MTLKDAQHIAHGLIQGYVGPDHKVLDMRSFHSALVTAHREGSDGAAKDVAQL
jgi:hypothetical protein